MEEPDQLSPEEGKKLFDARLAAGDSCEAVLPTRTPDAYPVVPVIPCDPEVVRPDEEFLPPNDPPAVPGAA